MRCASGSREGREILNAFGCFDFPAHGTPSAIDCPVWTCLTVTALANGRRTGRSSVGDFTVAGLPVECEGDGGFLQSEFERTRSDPRSSDVALRIARRGERRFAAHNSTKVVYRSAAALGKVVASGYLAGPLYLRFDASGGHRMASATNTCQKGMSSQAPGSLPSSHSSEEAS